MELYFKGLLIGVFSFLVIGLFHPIVIKTEYYTGTRFRCTHMRRHCCKQHVERTRLQLLLVDKRTL